MKYKIEEILPLVKELTEKYTGKASTSVTYEVAQQLMGAVLYCMNENRMSNSNGEYTNKNTGIAKRETLYSAKEAYEIGYQLVVEKVKGARSEYNKIIEEFNDYGNIAYSDTIVKGIPEFFKWYDARLNPKNHILTLDYPILADLSEFQGIDLICKYLKCIQLEQNFLKQFEEEYVREVLALYHPEYEDLFINICDVLLRRLLYCMLNGEKVKKAQFDLSDYETIAEIVRKLGYDQLIERMTELLSILVKEVFRDDREMFSYLQYGISDFATELVNAVENNILT